MMPIIFRRIVPLTVGRSILFPFDIIQEGLEDLVILICAAEGWFSVFACVCWSA